MNKLIRPFLLVHAVVALLIGVPLLAAPGRFLGALAWAPIDPLLSRMLGAALIAMGWGSLCGFRQADPGRMQYLVEVGALFCGLTVIGLLRNMLGASWPFLVWLILVGYALFAIGWIAVWLTWRRSPR